MKVSSNLFPQNTAPQRSVSGASEARRAFEAMLSANASRTRVAQAPLAENEPALGGATPPTNRAELKQADIDVTPMSRPGRVLDIKV